MDVEHTNDNYIDAEEELESVYRFSLFKRNNLIWLSVLSKLTVAVA